MKPYLYYRGLLELAKSLKGRERIHLGIRPYGFHAGNAMALLVYPHLLCEEMERLGKRPAFTFIISINDWEQDALDGPDYRRYPFNIHPKETTLFHLTDSFGCCASMTDHWQPRIEKELKSIFKKRFPSISLSFIRNSELIHDRFSRSFLLETLKHPKKQLAILKKHSGKPTLKSPLSFAATICPSCKSARTKTRVHDSLISAVCIKCGAKTKGKAIDFQYWWYHKPMFLARMHAFKIDVTISGGDHFSEGDFMIRRAYIRKFSPGTREPKMLFTPLVLAPDGQKMSKSRNNTSRIRFKKLLELARGYNKQDLALTKRDIIPSKR